MPDLPSDFFAKPHNYLMVYEVELGRSHYLDRYADEDGVALCGLNVQTSEVEHDLLGYLGGVDCLACTRELHRRVLGCDGCARVDPDAKFCPVCGDPL